MTARVHVLIVGAGLAGLRCAEALRGAGHAGPVTLLGAERHLPYDRPPLSKAILAGTAAEESATLRSSSDLSGLGVQLCRGRAAAGLDTAARTVKLADGDVIAYDRLVIATGVAPRPLPALPARAGVHTLRTLDDARAIRRALGYGPRRVVVVGAGVLGCETAATLRTAGHDVTLVEPAPGPLWQALNGAASAAACDVIRSWHERRGVATHFGRGVAAPLNDGDRVRGVLLDDGTELPADLVVVAAGSLPQTDWLRDSGVPLADGVACDRFGAVLGPDAPDVWAAGDVARVHRDGRSFRVEHWTHAGDSARAVAANICAVTPNDRTALPTPELAYFWSDQFDLKLQVVGDPTAADEVVLAAHEAGSGRFLALFGARGRFVAAAGAGKVRAVIGSRQFLGGDRSLADVVAHWT
ncbi:MAG TPA: FAD-dependent oxidoreductase [Dactylosporangium sp.]|nr:FAD-dependent oxidoreductase [Dactylosporangium sp.]